MDNPRPRRTRRAGSLIGAVLVLAALFAMPGLAAAPASSSDVSALLRQARWTHEPAAVIAQAVRLLDQRLDENPGDRLAWRQLGEALAIGGASSTHAESERDAWRRGYELDPTDCHAGALAARATGPAAEAEQWVQELERRHPGCPEALYLSALRSASGTKARAERLQNSIAIRASAEALVALGQERLIAREWPPAERAFSAALRASPLFPEDWRPDGWVAVHARLGLAWSHYSRGQMQAARREYAAFMSWFTAPGPWHDLSEAEEGWQRQLAARWPDITGTVAK